MPSSRTAHALLGASLMAFALVMSPRAVGFQDAAPPARDDAPAEDPSSRDALAPASAPSPESGIVATFPAPEDDAVPASPVFLAGDERRAFAAEVAAAMGAVDVIVARFVQRKTLALFDETVTSHGVLVFARPDRLRWEFHAPFRSILVVDGDAIAKFEHDGDAFRARRLERMGDVLLAVMGRVRTWFSGHFDADDAEYEALLARAPRPMVRFVPRAGALARTLASIDMLLGDDLSSVRTVVIREHGGDETVLEYTEIARNVPLPEDAFASTDAPGALDLDALAAAAEAAR